MSFTTLLNLGVRSIPGLNMISDLRARNQNNIKFNDLKNTYSAKLEGRQWKTANPDNQGQFDDNFSRIKQFYRENNRVFRYGMALTAAASITAVAMGALGIGMALAGTVVASALYYRYADAVSLFTLKNIITQKHPLSGLLH